MNTINLTKSLKTLLGVAVLGLAALTQSFSENARVEKVEKLAGETWVNTSNSGEYSQLAIPEEYQSANCQQTNQHSCAFVRTAQPGTVPSSFDAEEAADLEAAGLIEEVDSNKGVYTP
ncbi:hypothetical protein [Sphingobacterium sp. JB170]|uniref:hypothetical protein n=1 Tax=Sphingobacterium sp. JB170 TaxID=1434842 RepID=UPI00097EBCEC|nr:hypothetical protein [Sphingobacterium sp. JB170]SJN50428.1 hypothetical protein FM107_20540 [Sphingobacterium sp. JB170]